MKSFVYGVGEHNPSALVLLCKLKGVVTKEAEVSARTWCLFSRVTATEMHPFAPIYSAYRHALGRR